jgi:hypothetical protein
MRPEAASVLTKAEGRLECRLVDDMLQAIRGSIYRLYEVLYTTCYEPIRGSINDMQAMRGSVYNMQAK